MTIVITRCAMLSALVKGLLCLQCGVASLVIRAVYRQLGLVSALEACCTSCGAVDRQLGLVSALEACCTSCGAVDRQLGLVSPLEACCTSCGAVDRQLGLVSAPGDLLHVVRSRAQLHPLLQPTRWLLVRERATPRHTPGHCRFHGHGSWACRRGEDVSLPRHAARPPEDFRQARASDLRGEQACSDVRLRRCRHSRPTRLPLIGDDDIIDNRQLRRLLDETTSLSTASAVWWMW